MQKVSMTQGSAIATVRGEAGLRDEPMMRGTKNAKSASETRTLHAAGIRQRKHCGEWILIRTETRLRPTARSQSASGSHAQRETRAAMYAG